MKNFNYIITNNINSKQYIGAHSTNNINDSYMGSGLLIGRAKKKYGEENFDREILCYTKTIEEAFKNEILLIKKYNTLVPNGYNIHPGGGPNNGGPHSKESNQKNRESNIGRQAGKNHPNYGKKLIHSEELDKQKFVKKEDLEYWLDIGWSLGALNRIKNKQSKRQKGIKPSKELIEKRRIGHIGHRHSKESKQKISKGGKGRKNPIKGKTYEEVYGEERAKEIIEKLVEAHTGVPLSKEHAENISKALIGREFSEEWRDNLRKAAKGVPKSEEHKKHIGDNSRGTKWINNGKINKKVKEEKLPEFLANGWKLRRVKKQKK